MAGETGTVESGLDTTALNLAVYYAFRPGLIFDPMATVKPTKQSHVGAAVTFTKMNDMAVSTTPLNEYTDVVAEVLTDAPLTVTLAEHGKATISTAKLRGTGFIEFDPTAVNRLAYNAGRTIDLLAQTALSGEAASEYIVAASPGNNLNSVDLRNIKAQLENADVPPFADGFYRAVVSPYQSRDLRAESETAAAGWRAPHSYAAPGEIFRGEIGEYEGFRFIVNSTLIAGTEASTRRALFVGQEALAKAFSKRAGFGPFPSVRPGPVTDKLMRFRPMGWYWLGAYKCFRPEAVVWADFQHLAVAV